MENRVMHIEALNKVLNLITLQMKPINAPWVSLACSIDMRRMSRNDQERIFADGKLFVLPKDDPTLTFDTIDENVGVTAVGAFAIMIQCMWEETDICDIHRLHQGMVTDILHEKIRENNEFLCLESIRFLDNMHFYEHLIL